MNRYDSLWNKRTLRFVEGEIALLQLNVRGLFNTPCEVLEVGPFKCPNCNDWHDYVIHCADGTNTTVDDSDLKKLPPPEEDISEHESEELTDDITA